MRVALVTAAFRARSPIDLASHVRSLAPALARAGASVEVFAGVTGSGLAPYAQRRSELVEPITGKSFGVTVLEMETEPDQDRAAEAFASFLERERPTVCHFEHLDPMGVGLVREAKIRRISTLYAAHDTWPAHDRVSLTMPDLSPFELGDTEAEARSLAAERILASRDLVPGTAEYDEEARRLLHQDLKSPDEAAALREARESIEMRRAEKRVALSGVDRRFAASRLLSRELSAAVGRAFTFRAPGVDKAVLAAVFAEPVDSAVTADSVAAIDFSAATANSSGGSSPSLERAKGPIRLVYMGTTARTSGLHILLDAVSRIRADEKGPALALRLALERTDDLRDAEIHSRAQLLGVDVVWSRGSSVDASAALDGADLLVMPSLWGEVAPSALRIALAAGVPVVASRMPGVVEAAPSTASVLVSPGSVDSLTEALTRLASESGSAALQSMRSAALSEQEANTKDIDDEALEWLDTYQSLADAAEALERARALRSAAPAAGDRDADALTRQEPFGGPKKPDRKRLAALVEVEQQIAELRSLSNTELFARAQAGVSKLRQAFGLKATDAELLARVVARGGAMRDRAEHDEVARKEVARALHELRVAQAALRAEESVRSRRIADLHSVLEQYEHEVAARAEEAARAAQRADAATAQASVAVASRDEAVAGQAQAVSARDEAISAMERAVADAEAASEVSAKSAAEKAEAKAEAKSLRAELEEMKSQLASAELENQASASDKKRLAKDAEEAGQRYREVSMQVEAAKKALTDVEAARDELARSIDERSSEIRRLRERLVKPAAEGEATDGPSASMGDLESIEAYCVSLERDLEALQRNDSWVADEADRLIDTISAAVTETSSKDGEEATASLERMTTRLERMTAELDWRRAEMENVSKAADSLRARFLGGPLASRVRSWAHPPQDVVVSMSALAEVSSRPAEGDQAGASELDRAPAKSEALDPDSVESAGAPLPSGVARQECEAADAADDPEASETNETNGVTAEATGSSEDEVKS
ncbi:Glycosyl transferases group 1 [Planctomycetes bacterium Poly30]|uniref:Glycosyl transferases group 1 n=1 Tax=Saltatorellus ferox TaxID=2528018 RepID=A0A518EWP1_9BACT|nr:Glycosyl transferases group 1 [Planctomycetes bacterium Poly30]